MIDSRYRSQWCHHSPVITHIFMNVKFLNHSFANMKPPRTPEKPQTLRYRVLLEWAVLEIPSILFCFKSIQSLVESLWSSRLLLLKYLRICSTCGSHLALAPFPVRRAVHGECSAWLEKSGLALLLKQTALAWSFGRGRGKGGTSLTTSKPLFFFF